MKKEDVKIGLRVKYVVDRYGNSEYNPLWDSKYGKIKGTIDKIRETFAGVQWDNGKHNSYIYSVIEPIEPDILGSEDGLTLICKR